MNENSLNDVFKLTNLDRREIDIKLGSGKGGSFFVIPKNSSYLIKSITLKGMSIIRMRHDQKDPTRLLHKN